MDDIKVVIIEDEFIAAEFLGEILEEHGIEVLSIIDSGKEAMEVCPELKPDVVFMDVMLSDNISGSEAAVAISRKCDCKIIFLTAHMDEEMVDYAVESKAAGYLTKPYNEAQIIATLRLAIADQGKHTPKTNEEKHTSHQIALADNYIYHTNQKRLTRNGYEIPLGATGLKLMELLCSQPGMSISNEQISMHVWGEWVNSRTLRSLIHRVRSATNDKLIENVSKTGYKIVIDAKIE